MGLRVKIKAIEDYHGANGTFFANIKKGKTLEVAIAEFKCAMATGAFQQVGDWYHPEPKSLAEGEISPIEKIHQEENKNVI
jgi:hypothetical protein